MKMPDRITDGLAYPPDLEEDITDEDRENARTEAEERVSDPDYLDERELCSDHDSDLSFALQHIDSAHGGNQEAIKAAIDALWLWKQKLIDDEAESILDGD